VSLADVETGAPLAKRRDHGDNPVNIHTNTPSPPKSKSNAPLLLWFSSPNRIFITEKGQVVEPGVGVKLLAVMPELEHGWVKWDCNQPVEFVLGKVARGYRPPPRYTLDDTDRRKWEQPDRDPWQLTSRLLLIWPTGGTSFVFSTSTKGGTCALGNLARNYGHHLRIDQRLPVVELNAGSYWHATVGKTIHVPVFEIVGWVS
jgi:hypothetical protein